MKYTIPTLLISLILSCFSATCAPAPEVHDLSVERRTANTCGDPSTSEIYYEAFSPSRTAHLLQRHSAFVSDDSVLGEDFQIQAASFRAWRTQQTGTSPLYRLAAAGSPPPDYVFAVSTDANPSTVSGFATAPFIIGYVYATQICDSIPLYVVSVSSSRDHYYTVDADERDELVNDGWTDQGIAAYVLPVYTE
ncbi:hypothetical protein GALMADRAFT_1353024 [Galerina marginata CBS 339.88]|uniref:DUF5648 domain-containing protein n=1 Tax=Galerina marginata (strain CBS 339.88) TaxID=685588 RepID=A0A067SGB4_GALM3|nr:hypothetical protein GALMADRAFT_1353024 [Galerina marginata CBS 339.88]